MKDTGMHHKFKGTFKEIEMNESRSSSSRKASEISLVESEPGLSEAYNAGKMMPTYNDTKRAILYSKHDNMNKNLYGGYDNLDSDDIRETTIELERWIRRNQRKKDKEAKKYNKRVRLAIERHIGVQPRLRMKSSFKPKKYVMESNSIMITKKGTSSTKKLYDMPKPINIYKYRLPICKSKFKKKEEPDPEEYIWDSYYKKYLKRREVGIEKEAKKDRESNVEARRYDYYVLGIRRDGREYHIRYAGRENPLQRNTCLSDIHTKEDFVVLYEHIYFFHVHDKESELNSDDICLLKSLMQDKYHTIYPNYSATFFGQPNKSLRYFCQEVKDSIINDEMDVTINSKYENNLNEPFLEIKTDNGIQFVEEHAYTNRLEENEWIKYKRLIKDNDIKLITQMNSISNLTKNLNTNKVSKEKLAKIKIKSSYNLRKFEDNSFLFALKAIYPKLPVRKFIDKFKKLELVNKIRDANIILTEKQIGYLEYKGTFFNSLQRLSESVSTKNILAFVLDSGEYHFVAIDDGLFTPKLKDEIENIKYHRRNVSFYELNLNHKGWNL